MGRRRRTSPIKGAIRAGKRTANHTIYLFGPLLIFAGFLTVWYVADPTSFNTMLDAVSKFFRAVRGG